jgi:predicted transcriptional regulator
MSTDLTVSLDETTLDALDDLAKKTDRSLSQLASEAIQNYVDLNAWHIEKIREGIAAADRGDFASEEDLDRIEAKLRAKL